MKGDFTRDTFRKKKHYRRVPMQQGRVDVDADWNEQVSIGDHHERTSLRDVIGESGAPQENPGFGIIIPTTDSGSYKIGKGRYYVDGIICENEEDVDAKDQPDLPPLEDIKYPFKPQVYGFPTEAGGIYLAYLHVWERHLTAIDDPEIRESALGGPDTATRTKVVWQVQLLRVGRKVSRSIVDTAQAKFPGDSGVTSHPNDILFHIQPTPPQVSASDGREISFSIIENKSGEILVTDPNADKNHNEKDTINLNINIEGQDPVSRKAEETEVNNGKFRVKWRINDPSNPRFLLVKDKDEEKVFQPRLKSNDKIIATYTYESDDDLANFGCSSPLNDWDKLVASSSGGLRARSEPEMNDTTCSIPPQAKYTGLENQLYRVEIHDAGVVGSNGGTSVPPTFNWSRDNGIVVTRIAEIVGNTMTVTDTGRDKNLHFLPQQWVEVTDDRYELWGIPGSMVKLDDVRGNDLLFNPATLKGESITNDKFPQKFNPKVRRWDNNGEAGLIEVTVPPENEGYINLESGVQVKFSEGTYHTGDYWLIPARTLKRDIEWPQTETGPIALPPEGIEHHFTRLAILRYTGRSVKLISDCRKFFPPAIDRTSAATITTGIITIEAKHFQDPTKEVNFGPFEHGIEDAETPPAIILGKIPDKTPDKFPPEVDHNEIENGTDTNENYVSFMEDRRLYPFKKNPYDKSINEATPSPHFKAVGINLTTFKINIQHNQVGFENLKLRFWAISAGRQVNPQEGQPVPE